MVAHWVSNKNRVADLFPYLSMKGLWSSLCIQKYEFNKTLSTFILIKMLIAF
jgi:hypothetical protein